MGFSLTKRPLRTVIALGSIFIMVAVFLNIFHPTKIPSVIVKHSGNNMISRIGVTQPPISKSFLVDTPSCKIPDVNPFDPSIKDIIGPPFPAINCGTPKDVTFQEGSELFVNKDVVQKHYLPNALKHCCFWQIQRKKGSDQFIEYSKTPKCFQYKVRIPYEFVKVACFNTDGHVFYRNFHAFVVKAPPEKSVSQGTKEKLNVLVIGIDAVSRLNFIRQMPQTRKFLVENLSAVELNGYNKVADNTFVNIVPMFTGNYLEDLHWDESKSNQPFDEYSMIWKNYSSRGYRTLFAEDFPKIAIFNFLKFGFKAEPTTHYLRPFTLAMEAETKKWRHNEACFGARLETDIVLDYTHQFAKTYVNDNYFGFTFITRLTHNDINSAGAADEPHADFLQKMHMEGLLNNTVLFYISDHGARFGTILNTYIGKLEERLPLMYVVFPKWFHSKYPELSNNLALNTRRLTTPFDIHETFVHLLNFDGKASKASLKQRGISILNEIPKGRSCEDASIMPHWCACQNAKPISSQSSEAVSAGKAVVNQINHENIEHMDICERFSLEEVTDAMKMQPDDKVLTFKQSLNDVIDRKVFYGNRARGAITTYLLTVKVTPGGGLFEATVRYHEDTGKYEVSGDMSRIDKYGDTSKCVDVHRLKKFCLCKNM